MENELQILNNINNNATQREIARRTGMSLGSVNVLIQRLVNKGMLKIERLTPKTIRYILTSEGLKEKAEATYRYIVDSYKYINAVNSRVDSLLEGELQDNFKEIYLCGSQDEIYQLLVKKLTSSNKAFKNICLEDMYSIENAQQLGVANTNEKAIYIVWHPEYQKLLENNNIPYLNLLDVIS